MKNGRLQRSDVPWWLVRGITQFHAAPRNGSARDCARMMCQVLPLNGVILGVQPARWPTVGDGGVALWLSCVKHWGGLATLPARGREADVLRMGREYFGRVLALPVEIQAWGLLGQFAEAAEAFEARRAVDAYEAERLGTVLRPGWFAMRWTGKGAEII